MDGALRYEVLVLAAGLGTRMRPLTLSKPKPLLEVAGRPLIDYSLALVQRSSAKRVFVNLHHLGDQVRAYVGDGSRWGLEVEYSEENPILDTGGALRKIEPDLREDLLVAMNSDSVFGPEFSLDAVVRAHLACVPAAEITAVVRDFPASGGFGDVLVGGNSFVCGLLGTSYRQDPSMRRKMFAGVQVISRKAFSYFPEYPKVFSSTRVGWPAILQGGGRIFTVSHDGYWSDIGTPERLREASKDLMGVFRDS